MPKACRACKQGKRRCDKAVPRCSPCERAGRDCDYSERPILSPTAEDFALMKARLDDLERRITVPSSAATSSTLAFSPGVNEAIDVRAIGNAIISTPGLEPEAKAMHLANFPTALFLDIDSFVMARMQLPVPSSACVPMEALAILNEGNVVIDTAEAYFSTVHSWLPILSKKRMDLGIPAHGAGPDLALLILAMKLVVSVPSEAGNDNLYCTLKRFVADLEHQGTVSLLYLQALILISVYEYGHAIYPAAWMTVGACARFAHMLGLSCRGIDEFWGSQARTWTEVEEQRRAWWAIFIIDRLVSMGSRRPYCFPGPSSTAKLPAADDAWESGNVAAATSDPVTTPFSVLQSPFARLCKAAMYVDSGTEYVQGLYSIKDAELAEVSSVISEIQGFCTLLGSSLESSDAPSFPVLSTALCIAQSAIFQVLDPLTCPEKLRSGAGYRTSADAKTSSELNLQMYATATIQDTCHQVQDFFSRLELPLTYGSNELLATTSPFVLHIVYNTIATLHWYMGESGDPVYQAGVKQLTSFMQAASRRWKVASKYLDLAALWDIAKRGSSSGRTI